MTATSDVILPGKTYHQHHEQLAKIKLISPPCLACSFVCHAVCTLNVKLIDNVRISNASASNITYSNEYLCIEKFPCCWLADCLCKFWKISTNTVFERMPHSDKYCHLFFFIYFHFECYYDTTRVGAPKLYIELWIFNELHTITRASKWMSVFACEKV